LYASAEDSDGDSELARLTVAGAAVSVKPPGDTVGGT
jgi:hypothetical protein